MSEWQKFVRMGLAGLLLAPVWLRVAATDGWKTRVPVPVFDKEPGYVDLYWKAWELAYDHVKKQPGLPQSPYMDEAFHDGAIWIWDTCFMVLFCKYAPQDFPGVETFNNFYEPFHTDRFKDRSFPINIQHPDNPPLFAWAEHDNYLFTDDDVHVRKLLTETKYLQKHFQWFHEVPKGWKFEFKGGASVEVYKDTTALGYGWAGCPSGMDNTPRRQHGLWIDAIAQQGLSALSISRMAERLGEEAIAAKWKARYESIKRQVNQFYWDEEDGIYYDVERNGKAFLKVKTPASFWPMLAEMCSPGQAERMVEHIRDPETFGGPRPWVTVARDDPAFATPDGDYWRGGIWLPTAYMATKALEKYGYYEDADAAAEQLLAHMLRTYRAVEPHTIWECYSPTRDHPVIRKNGHVVREDFCGWSALGPISMFIENVLGFHHVDAKARRVEWRLYQDGRHGVKNFRFGKIVTDVLYDGKGKVSVTSNEPYTLVINGREHALGRGAHQLSVQVPSREKYKLKVMNGSGSGTYRPAEAIRVEASAPPPGLVFSEWMVEGGVIEDASSANSLFWMPNRDAMLVPVFAQAEEPDLPLARNGFESGIKSPTAWNDFSAKSSILDLWYIPLARDRFATSERGDGGGTYIANGVAMRGPKCTALYQASEAPEGGGATLSFAYKNIDAAGDLPNEFSWAVWSYAADGNDDAFIDGSQYDRIADQPVSGQLLASGDFAPGSRDWGTFTSERFVIPEGQERIVIGLAVNMVQALAGDRIGLDNVVLESIR